MSYVISAHCVVGCVLHRAERDKELEKRIRQHTEAMHERRRKSKQGTPQQEMEAAMRELEVVSSQCTRSIDRLRRRRRRHRHRG